MTEPLTKLIRGLKSGGIISKWTRDEVENIPIMKSKTMDAKTENHRLDLEDLHMAFSALISGLILATFSFALEKYFDKWL